MGTLIPQGGVTEEFSGKVGPGVISLFRSLQLFDVYHSVWFFLLMGLLAANLVACSWARLPATLRLISRKDVPGPGSLFKEPDSFVSADVEGTPESISGRALSILRKMRHRRTGSAGDSVYGEKGAFSHFGVYFVHFSVLLIIAGAVTGSIFGFDGFVNIPVGGSVDAVSLKSGRGTHPLGFSIRCDSFSAEFYETGAPREFRSEISILKDGAPVLQKKPLTVNNPIEFEGVRIFQASYGEDAGGALLKVKYPAGSKLVTVRQGESFELPGNLNPVYVMRVEKDLMRMGPAVKLSVDSPEGEVQMWIFKDIEKIRKDHPGIFQMAPVFNPGLLNPYRFSLEEVASRQFTGLQVNRDPGLPLAGAGAAVMIFGFLVVYLTSRRQIWIRIEQGKKGRTRISVAGRSNRDPAGLEREKKKILELVSESSRREAGR